MWQLAELGRDSGESKVCALSIGRIVRPSEWERRENQSTECLRRRDAQLWAVVSSSSTSSSWVWMRFECHRTRSKMNRAGHHSGRRSEENELYRSVRLVSKEDSTSNDAISILNWVDATRPNSDGPTEKTETNFRADRLGSKLRSIVSIKLRSTVNLVLLKQKNERSIEKDASVKRILFFSDYSLDQFVEDPIQGSLFVLIDRLMNVEESKLIDQHSTRLTQHQSIELAPNSEIFGLDVRQTVVHRRTVGPFGVQVEHRIDLFKDYCRTRDKKWSANNRIFTSIRWTNNRCHSIVGRPGFFRRIPSTKTGEQMSFLVNHRKRVSVAVCLVYWDWIRRAVQIEFIGETEQPSTRNKTRKELTRREQTKNAREREAKSTMQALVLIFRRWKEENNWMLTKSQKNESNVLSFCDWCSDWCSVLSRHGEPINIENIVDVLQWFILTVRRSIIFTRRFVSRSTFDDISN